MVDLEADSVRVTTTKEGRALKIFGRFAQLMTLLEIRNGEGERNHVKFEWRHKGL